MIKNTYSIQWTQDTFCFSEQEQVAQQKFNTVKNFRANSVLEGKRKLHKILDGEKIFNTMYSVYIHLGVIRVIWASVVCNLDQSRDWL